MSQPKQLFNLQLLDNEIDKAQRRLGEIEIALNDNSILKKVELQATAAEEAYTKAKKAQKIAGHDVEAQQTKITNNERTTYSGSVTNPKELADLQMEAEALKRHLAVLEDTMLESMLEFEEAESQHQLAQSQLEETQKETSESKAALTAEQNTLLEFIEEKSQERAAYVAPLDAESIELYEKLRTTKNGIAVAEVVDKSCSACGVNLTPAMAQAARSTNKITSCTSCRRILYSV
jgi:predicted  nucleic acid-binding Zn-ribbon protein